MDPKRVLVLTAALLVLNACNVYSQTRFDFLSPPPITTSPLIQTASVVAPALSPIIEPCNTYTGAPIVHSYSYGSFAPSIAPPTIIIEDNDSNWNQLFYFLLFAIKNRRGGWNDGGCGNGCSNGCGGCSNCDWRYGCNNYYDSYAYPYGLNANNIGGNTITPNSNTPWWIPINNDVSGSSNQSPTEINLIISTDQGSSSVAASASASTAATTTGV